MKKTFKQILKKGRGLKRNLGNNSMIDPNPIEQDDFYFILENIRKTFKKYKPKVFLSLKSGSTDNVVNVHLKYYHTTLRYVFFIDSGEVSTFSTTNSNAYSIKVHIGTLDTLEKRNLFTNQLRSELRKKLAGIHRESIVINILKRFIRDNKELSVEHSVDLDNVGIDVLVRYKDTNRALCFDVKSKLYDAKRTPLSPGKTIASGRFDELLKLNTIETIICNEKTIYRTLKRRLERKVNNFLKKQKQKQMAG